MARFMGTVEGGRGVASRLGHATTGLTVRAKSYSGTITVELGVDYMGRDTVRIGVREGSTNGAAYTLYSGLVVTLADKPSLNTLLRDLAIETIAEAAE